MIWEKIMRIMRPAITARRKGDYPFEDGFKGYLTNNSPGYPENHVYIDAHRWSYNTHLSYHHNNDAKPNWVVVKIGFRLNQFIDITDIELQHLYIGQDTIHVPFYCLDIPRFLFQLLGTLAHPSDQLIHFCNIISIHTKLPFS